MKIRHIIIEGLSCVGKSSIARELIKRIPDAVYVKSFSLKGTYELIKEDEYKDFSFEELFAAHIVERYEEVKERLAEGKIVIQDRSQISYRIFHKFYIEGSNTDSKKQARVLDKDILIPDVIIYCHADRETRKNRIKERGTNMDKYEFDEFYTPVGIEMQREFEEEIAKYDMVISKNTQTKSTEILVDEILTEMNKKEK